MNSDPAHGASKKGVKFLQFYMDIFYFSGFITLDARYIFRKSKSMYP